MLSRSVPCDLQVPGGARLSFAASAGGIGMRLLLRGELVAGCEMPASVMVFQDGRSTWHRAPYRSVSRRRVRLAPAPFAAAEVIAEAEVGAASSRVVVRDSYRVRGDHLRIHRTVEVHGGSPGPGFLSALEWDLGGPALEDPWFAPGVWYGTNEHAPDYAIGSPSARRAAGRAMVREDRLPLPFMLRWDPRRSVAFSMAHVESSALTVAGDDEDLPLVDARLGFGSLGVDHDGSAFCFWFPGSEGPVSYPPMWTIPRGNRQADSPVNPFAGKGALASSRGECLRLHPLADGFRQRYLLRVDLHAEPSFERACDTQWRRVAAEYRPRARRAPLARIQRTSIDLLAGLAVRRGGAVGIPTWIDCFGGCEGRLQNTFGIGFVSRNLEAAHLLVAAGWRRRDRALRELGIQILDFWVNGSGQGLSHTEYDPSGERWVDSEDDGTRCVFLRDQSESRRACLKAWELERAHGQDHPRWLAWAAGYGEWLAANQLPDGSFHRSYRLDGTPVSPGSADAAHVIPFFLALDRARGGDALLGRALAAARFLQERWHRRRIYIGATLDNPNCTDKESSALAFEAYLALYEAGAGAQWLEAAQDAARVCESWIFLWNIPMPVDDPHRFFPAGRGTTGFQVITTGFSAFDMYLTRHAGDYARLARHTGDPHYRQIARILLHGTKGAVQLRGELGYARPGMQVEHWSMGRGRGYGLNSGWLPWVSTSHLVSIAAARECF